jgi:hypothetical protein
MNTECYVEIPADKLRDAVKQAYALSSPQGLGFVHYREGELSDEDVDAILSRGDERRAASMDYVRGRSCKFHVFRDGERLFIRPSWYDHSDWHTEQLLKSLGIENGPELMAAARDAQRLENEKWERENP